MKLPIPALPACLCPGRQAASGAAQAGLPAATLAAQAGDRHRMHYVKATVRVHRYPDRKLAVFHGPRCLARYDADGRLLKPELQAVA